MSIQPIDLQTLFMRLSQVGKEQSVQREAAHVAQTQQGSEMARRSEQESQTVNQTRELEDGPEAIKDEEQGRSQPRGEGEKHKEERNEDDENERREIFRDPALGNKIDITG